MKKSLIDSKLRFPVFQRRSDRDYDDVKEVGVANSLDNAISILRSYADRCDSVYWIDNQHFEAYEYSDDGTPYHVECWVFTGENHVSAYA